MNSELEEFKAAHDAAAEAVDKGANPDDFLNEAAHDHVRELADAYVAANPGKFADHADLPIEACVSLVDIFREAVAKGVAGMDARLWEVEVWLLHRFEPQNIGGTHTATIRIPNSVAATRKGK